MEIKRFRQIAFDSASAYLDYCRERNKGKETIKVKSIKQKEKKFVLMLDSPIRFPDSVRLRIKSPLFPIDNKELMKIVKLVCFTNSPANVIVSVRDDYYESFQELAPDMITFESDFTFLIEAVKNWYHEESVRIAPPVNENGVSCYEECPNETITKSQLAAVNTALSSDISYIWGAPGTGKTQYVLANCILEYIKAGQKVILMAPTNNALEQSIRGMLRVFDDNNIPNSYIYRLGNPTFSFAKEFPDLCHSTVSDYAVKRLKEEISSLTEENSEYIQYLNTKKNYEDFKLLKPSYTEFLYKKTELTDKLSSEEERKALYESKLHSIKHNLDKNNSDYEQLCQEKKSFSGKIKSLLSKSYKKSLEIRLSNFFEETDRLNREIDRHLKLIEKEKVNIDTINSELSKVKKELDITYKKILSLSPVSIDTDSNISIEQIESSIEATIEKYSNMEFDEQIPDIIKQKQDELELLLREQKIELKDRYIVACTVDYAFLHYGEFPQDIDHDACHIFVDEAAYCPMIKAGLFFSYGIPVTFLGDHMQLPPICEMSGEEIRESKTNAFLWSQSAIYFPEIFLNKPDIQDIFMRYLKNQDINTENMNVSALDRTHRFGNNLASILDKFVYKFGLNGQTDSPTKITVVNVPRDISRPKEKTNLEEAEAIYKYIKMQGSELSDYAVLTPYKAQRSALKHRLSYNTEVLTIHASQGREWDTVLLSVVDKHDKFFMDSTNPESNGLRIINTAISRAKKELVLFLDFDHWKHLAEQQLIGSIATSYTDYLESSVLSL